MRPDKSGVIAALLLTATAYYFSSTFSRENPLGGKTLSLNQPSKPSHSSLPITLALSPILASLPAQTARVAQPVSDTLHALIPELKEQPKDWRQFQPDTLTIEPFPGKPITFTREKTKDEGKYVTWIGRNSSIPGASLVGVSSASRYDAVMILPGMSQISVHVDPDGHSFVKTADPGSEGCGVSPAQPDREPAASDQDSLSLYTPTLAKATTGDIYVATLTYNVDVLFLYDAATLSSAQRISTDAIGYIDGYSKAVIESGNVLLAQSLVTSFQWRYLGLVASPTFVQSDYIVDDLNAIAPGGTLFEWVKTLRYQRGADQIMFWHGNQLAPDGYAGIAKSNRQNMVDPDYAISVVRWNRSYKTVTHELAHNFGCEHDRANADENGKNPTLIARDGDGIYAYGQLWNHPIFTTTTISTIMGYGNYIIPYYSNPGITLQVTGALAGFSTSSLNWGSQALGVAVDQPRAAYNAKVLQDNGLSMVGLAEEIFPPQVLSQPLSVNVSPGQTIPLSALVVGGGLYYQWSKDGQPISGATSSDYTKTGATGSDAGNYSLTATNSLGSVTTSNAVITVSNPPPSGGGSSGGGGGGSTSLWFAGLLSALVAGRWYRQRIP